MSDENIDQQKEQHRLGTIHRWNVPDGDWAADHDWTRYRGPAPWPVPGGWVFEDPEEGGWWRYYGDIAEGHPSDDSVLDELQADESVADPYDALDEHRAELAMLNVTTANPDEVSLRNPEDEELEWALKIDDTEVFRVVEPNRPDLMGAVAEALAAYHDGVLDERIGEIAPASGTKTEEERARERHERRKEENESLGDFA
jgi:hypothetical protein